MYCSSIVNLSAVGGGRGREGGREGGEREEGGREGEREGGREGIKTHVINPQLDVVIFYM